MISQRHALTSTGVLHYQVQSLLCLYHLKELDCRWREREAKKEEWRGGKSKKKKRASVEVKYKKDYYYLVST